MDYTAKSDLHTHTVFSHGKNDIEANVKEAIKKGLTTIAITDHGPGHPLYGVRSENIKLMRDEVDRLNEKHNEINILLGVEANLMTVSGETDIDEKLLKYCDLVLMGYHKMGFNLKDFPRFIIAPIFSREKWADKFAYTFKNAMERYPIDIITHPGYGINVNIPMLAEFAAQNNVALEVNSSHMSMSLLDIQNAMKSGAMLSVNSDAHVAQNVGNLSRGLGILKEANVPQEKIINMQTELTFRNSRRNAI